MRRTVAAEIRRARAPIVLLVVYAVTYVALHGTFGGILAALALAPVCAAGWVYGWRTGAVAGLLAIPLGVLLALVTQDPDTGRLVQAAPAYAVIIGTGAFVGWASTLNRRANAANVELLALHRAQAEFVMMVGHEFRTPLTGIQGFSEMIRDDPGITLDEARKFATHINSDARRLGRLISAMLDLDRMRSGIVTISPEPLDLNELIRSVATRLALGAPQHRLVLELDAALPGMSGDRDKLIQVVTNLLSNAVKYSPDGSDVTVMTTTASEGIEVSVADRGIGIPAAQLERVFEPYVRVDSEATRTISGTGLGLPIAREIVRLHGGRMWVESVEGEGSRFHFTLARHAPAAAASA
jgi:signal transduction histidine kinase